jgi:polo-like kinase 4
LRVAEAHGWCYRRVSSGQEVAIKMVNKAQMVASGMSERVKQEVEIHSRLKHPAILEVLGYFEDNAHVYLVLELCENGELAKSNRVFSEAEARRILEQVTGCCTANNLKWNGLEHNG